MFFLGVTFKKVHDAPKRRKSKLSIQASVDETEKIDKEKKPGAISSHQEEAASKSNNQNEFVGKPRTDNLADIDRKSTPDNKLDNKFAPAGVFETQSNQLQTNDRTETQSAANNAFLTGDESRNSLRNDHEAIEPARNTSVGSKQNLRTSSTNVREERKAQRRNSTLQGQAKPKQEKAKSRLCTVM